MAPRKIVPIVEGPGEVDAVPNLLSTMLHHRWDVICGEPLMAKGVGNLKKPGGLERFVELASLERGCAAVLVLADADRECPLDLARNWVKRLESHGTKFPVAIVLCNPEFEVWFLACADHLAGKHGGLPTTLGAPDNPEDAGGDPKSWLKKHLGRPYKETSDQLAFTRLLDFELTAQRSRSFRRLCHAVEELIEAMDNAELCVSPIINEI